MIQDPAHRSPDVLALGTARSIGPWENLPSASGRSKQRSYRSIRFGALLAAPTYPRSRAQGIGALPLPPESLTRSAVVSFRI